MYRQGFGGFVWGQWWCVLNSRQFSLESGMPIGSIFGSLQHPQSFVVFPLWKYKLPRVSVVLSLPSLPYLSSFHQFPNCTTQSTVEKLSLCSLHFMSGLSPAAFCCSSYLFGDLLITARTLCCHFTGFPPAPKLLTWTKHICNRLLTKHIKFSLTSRYCQPYLTTFVYIHALRTMIKN